VLSPGSGHLATAICPLAAIKSLQPLAVSDRGRIPASVVEQYEAATQGS